MRLKGITDEDFLQYKKPSMFIITSFCTFKCEKECPECHCQNSPLALAKYEEINDDSIVKRYINNPITSAIVFGGLEPLDQFDELIVLISKFRNFTFDDIVIYTGYNKEEISDKVTYLANSFKNIIIKFGRFVPNDASIYDEVLGITLASKNQYGEKIS